MYASIIFFVIYGIFCEKSRVSVPQKAGAGSTGKCKIMTFRTTIYICILFFVFYGVFFVILLS